MLAGTGYEFAAFQEFAEVLSRLDLSFVGTDLLDAIHERVDAAVKGFQRKSGYQVGFLGEAEGFKNGKDTVGAHELRTVQQGKSLFTHQLDGFPAKFIEYADRFALPAFVVHIAHTDKGQEKIGKRRKVARSSERTAVVDDRHHVVIEKVEDALHGNDLHTAMPQRQCMRLEQHHQFDDDRADFFNSVFASNTAAPEKDVPYEKITTFELGYGFSTEQVNIALNGYYTQWMDKSLRRKIGQEYANLTGLDAVHMGVELEATYRPVKSFELKGMFSLGDWKWKDDIHFTMYDEANNPIGTYDAYLKDVHVGNSAQIGRAHV